MPVNKNLERLMSETMNAASAGDLSAQWRYAFLLMDACDSYEQYKEEKVINTSCNMLVFSINFA